MTRRAGQTGYFVSPRYQFDKVLAATATLDEAVYQAGRLASSTQHFGTMFFAWHFEGASPRVRAFTVGGKPRWCKPCPQMVGNGCYEYCSACNGLGLVEE